MLVLTPSWLERWPVGRSQKSACRSRKRVRLETGDQFIEAGGDPLNPQWHGEKQMGMAFPEAAFQTFISTAEMILLLSQ